MRSSHNFTGMSLLNISSQGKPQFISGKGEIPMSDLRETMLPEESNLAIMEQEEPTEKHLYSFESNYHGLPSKQRKKDLIIDFRDQAPPEDSGHSFREVGYKVDLVQEVGAGINIPKIFDGNRKEESFQWISTHESDGDNANKRDKSIKLPIEILDQIKAAKESGAQNNIFKGLFDIGNAAYITINNRAFLWFYMKDMKPMVLDFEDIIYNMCKTQNLINRSN